jgi:hypothetical protein
MPTNRNNNRWADRCGSLGAVFLRRNRRAERVTASPNAASAIHIANTGAGAVPANVAMISRATPLETKPTVSICRRARITCWDNRKRSFSVVGACSP